MYDQSIQGNASTMINRKGPEGMPIQSLMSELAGLHAMTDSLHAHLDDLGKRLEPLLMPNPPMAESPDKLSSVKESRSPAVEALQRLNGRLNHLCDVVVALNRQLTV